MPTKPVPPALKITNSNFYSNEQNLEQNQRNFQNNQNFNQPSRSVTDIATEQINQKFYEKVINNWEIVIFAFYNTNCTNNCLFIADNKSIQFKNSNRHLSTMFSLRTQMVVNYTNYSFVFQRSVMSKLSSLWLYFTNCTKYDEYYGYDEFKSVCSKNQLTLNFRNGIAF